MGLETGLVGILEALCGLDLGLTTLEVLMVCSSGLVNVLF
jgi:hypothetical protein